jgi:hypothetical protein
MKNDVLHDRSFLSSRRMSERYPCSVANVSRLATMASRDPGNENAKPKKKQAKLPIDASKKELGERLGQEIFAMDWSKHSKHGETPEQARARYIASLRKEHPKMFTLAHNKNGKKRVPLPTFSQMYHEEFWHDATRLATLAPSSLPPWITVDGIPLYKRAYDGGGGKACPRCTRSNKDNPGFIWFGAPEDQKKMYVLPGCCSSIPLLRN